MSEDPLQRLGASLWAIAVAAWGFARSVCAYMMNQKISMYDFLMFTMISAAAAKGEWAAALSLLVFGSIVAAVLKTVSNEH